MFPTFHTNVSPTNVTVTMTIAKNQIEDSQSAVLHTLFIIKWKSGPSETVLMTQIFSLLLCTGM